MLRPLIANPLMLLALHGNDDDDEDDEDDHDDENDGEMHYYKLGDGAGSLLGKLAC